jgi:uncharacterized protein YjbJ (UPF0337 family)
MRLFNIDLSQLRGIFDKAVGLNKEFLGTLFGNENLANEGQSQQERATAELKALRSEVKAQAERAKAETEEKRQRTAQKVKESANQ